MNYEEYMKNVLGYSTCGCNNNMYNNYEQPFEEQTMDNYYYTMPAMYNNKEVELTAFYPEIYKLLHPMVCKICNSNMNNEITKELLEEMTNEVYKNFEPEESRTENNQSKPQTVLKNGDVRNPNIKETEISNETRQRNYLLRDLIQILLLNELGRPVPPPPPPMPRPPYYQFPGMQMPPQVPPPRPFGRNAYNNIQPQMRPRSF
jgi:hypothetical protein